MREIGLSGLRLHYCSPHFRRAAMVLLLRLLLLPTLALEGSVEEDAHASCRRGHGSPRAHLCPRPRLGRRATDVGSAAMQEASIVEQGLTCGVTRV